MRIPPATEVLELAFAAWAAGTVVFGVVTRVGGEVQRGHFKVVWIVCAVLWAVAGLGYRPALAVAGGCAATFAALYRDRDLAVGALTAAGGVAVLVLATRGSAVTIGYGVGAALLLGAVTNAMLLGHWHLNQPRLGTGPLRRLVWGLWAGLAAHAGASGVVLARASGAADGSAVLGATTAIAFTLFAAVLTGMVAHLVRRRSIMSGTGILYLEILLCFVAVFTGALGALA